MWPRQVGSISTSVTGTGAMRTERGTTVPTRMSKFTLVTRGAELVSTLERIVVFCSVVGETLPDVIEPAVPDVPPCLVPVADGDWVCWVVPLFSRSPWDCLVVGALLSRSPCDCLV